MKTIAQLRAERAQLLAQAKTLVEKPEQTAETRAQIDDLIAQSDVILKDIERREKVEQELATLEKSTGRAVSDKRSININLGAKDDGEKETGVTWREAPKPHATELREREYRFGQFLQAVMRSSQPGAKIDPLILEQRAATGLGETISSDGGFLVGTDFSAELLRRAYTMGQITSRCRRVPISTNANSLKINGVDESSRAAGSRWGGIRGYWVTEGAAVTASAPKFAQITLKLNKLGVLVYGTDELIQDAAALGSIVADAASEEIMYMTENAIINGTGAGQPLGVINANCLVSVTKETGQAATTFVAQNAMKMRSRLWAASRGNSAWFINQDVEPQLHQMSLTVGTGGVPVYLPANGLAGGPFDTLYGRPVIPIEYCPTLGTVGDVILGDFGQYLLADKGNIQSASSIHVQFLYDETIFRFIYRVDGQPTWNSTLTPANGSNTLSPFVVVATRS